MSQGFSIYCEDVSVCAHRSGEFWCLPLLVLASQWQWTIPAVTSEGMCLALQPDIKKKIEYMCSQSHTDHLLWILPGECLSTDLCLQLLLLSPAFFQSFGDFCAHCLPTAQLQLREHTETGSDDYEYSELSYMKITLTESMTIITEFLEQSIYFIYFSAHIIVYWDSMRLQTKG